MQRHVKSAVNTLGTVQGTRTSNSDWVFKLRNKSSHPGVVLMHRWHQRGEMAGRHWGRHCPAMRQERCHPVGSPVPPSQPQLHGGARRPLPPSNNSHRSTRAKRPMFIYRWNVLTTVKMGLVQHTWQQQELRRNRMLATVFHASIYLHTSLKNKQKNIKMYSGINTKI